MGWDNNVGFMSYGKHFQEHRRMLNRYLSQDACRSYQVYQAQEARRLVENLRLSPENFINHLSRQVNSVLFIIFTLSSNVNFSTWIDSLRLSFYALSMAKKSRRTKVPIFGWWPMRHIAMQTALFLEVTLWIYFPFVRAKITIKI